MDLITEFVAFSRDFGRRVEDCSIIPGDAQSVTKNINALAELEGKNHWVEACSIIPDDAQSITKNINALAELEGKHK